MQDIVTVLISLSLVDQVPSYKTNFTWLDLVFEKFAYLDMLFNHDRAATTGSANNVNDK